MHFLQPNTVPHFKSSLHVEAIDQDLLLIVSETKRSILRGSLVVQVAAAINGHRKLADIIDALKYESDAASVLNVLEHLASKGYLSTEPVSNHAAAFWELMQGEAQSAAQNLANTAIQIDSTQGLSTKRLMQTLTDSGLHVSDDGSMVVVLTDDYLRDELNDICARASGKPILLVKPVGITPTIGPIIHAQHGSCLSCLQFWIRNNRPVETLLTRLHQGKPFHLPIVQNVTTELAVYGLLASCIASLIALQKDRIALQHTLLALDIPKLEITRHRLIKRPQCPQCGNPMQMQQQALQFPELQSVTGINGREGGYRQHDARKTYEQYQHLISPISGAVSYLHPMPRRHAGIRKVYVAGYIVCPNTIPRGNSFDKIAAGKGQSDDQARTSALCEALERFSAVYQGDELCIRGSMNSLGSAAIHFNALQNFSDTQYEDRQTINRQSPDPRQQIPLRFERNIEIDWTIAWSLAKREQRYIPLSYCFAEAPASSGSAYGIHNPNGAAAGSSLEEAILQGFLELVERDATAIWWYNKIPRQAIDLDSFADPYFARLQREYHELGWQVWVLDLSHDLGISVCAAIAFEPQQHRFAIGFGCHLNAQLAVQRSLTELNQLFDPSGDSPAPWDRSRLQDEQFLFPTGSPRTARQLASSGGQDLKTDIESCIELLWAHKLEMLVINKTRPDIGLAVVQVIVPGLRHFWPRFGPGRLYSVPVTMGWLAQARREAELNPVALFL